MTADTADQPPAAAVDPSATTSTPAAEAQVAVRVENVKVAVRVRPMGAKEMRERQSRCIVAREDQVIVGKQRSFSFDFVFDEESTQERIYADSCAPLVAGCLQGYNATVFAYGQTGSGKTYTMGSGGGFSDGQPECGIIPRAVESLFDALDALRASVDVHVRCSYLEIYNEEVKDLLHPRTPSKSISIREDAAGGIFVLGVQERAVASREQLVAALEAGSTWRTTGSTLMNAASSRSHSLFTIFVEQRPHAPGSERTCAKLHLVDLAGSERAKKTGAVEKRFKESVSINQGLLALGKVIAALCEDRALGRRKDPVTGHVPYRESKLTRLLQDSLGGNAKTLMVACVGPADGNLDESLNTLRYASRARQIHNKPVANIEVPSIVDLRGEIAALQQQLAAHQTQPGGIVQMGGVRGGGLPTALGDPDFSQSRAAEKHGASMPLSSAMLDAIRSTLGAESLARLLESLPAEGATPSVGRVDTPIQLRTPRPSSDSKPVEKLRQTLIEWGHAEAMRIQLLACAPAHGSSDGVAEAPVSIADGEVLLTERDTWDSIDAHGSRATPMKVIRALRGAAERGQLLQALCMQHLADLEEEHRQVRQDKVLKERRDEEMSSLKAELAEAKADLLRDETIFADKLKELRTLTRAHEALQVEHAALQADRLDARSGREAAAAENTCSLKTPPSSATTRSLSAASPCGSVGDGAYEDASSVLSPSAMKAAPEASGGILGEAGGASGEAGGDAVEKIETLQESIRELDAQREQLQSDQRSLNSKVDQATAESDALSMDHEAQQERLSSSVRDLTLNIRLKEELIRDLARADEEAKSVVSSYQARMRDMSQHIASLQEELQTTKREMESAERLAGRSEEQKRSLRNEYERRLRETESQLAEMRKRQKEQERALKSREAAERQLHDLRAEVGKMKAQQAALKDTMKTSAARYDQSRMERERELSALRRHADESTRRVRSLELANSRQKERLQRQQGQVAAAQSKLKRAQAAQALGRAGTVDRQTRTPNRQQTNTPAAATSALGSRLSGGTAQSASPVEDGRPSRNEEAVAREAAAEAEAIEAQAEELVRRKEAAEALELELARREAVLTEREAVLASREELQLRQLRSSISLRHSINGLSEQLAEVDAEIEAKRAGLGTVSEAELTGLLATRREVQDRIAELEALGQVGGSELLDAAASSELRELDEQLEDLTAQLEHKNVTIGELRHSLTQDSDGETGVASTAISISDSLALRQQVAQMSLPVARRVLQSNINRLLELRHEQKVADHKMETAEMHIREQETEIAGLRGTLEARLRQASQEHDQQMNELRKQHEMQLAALASQQLQQQPSSGEQVASHSAVVPAATESPQRANAQQGSPSASSCASSLTPEGRSAMMAVDASPSREAMEQLGRDNFYFKQSNRELRKKLKEAGLAAQEQRYQMDEARKRVESDERVQARLEAELQNLRSYLAAHPGATPTRVTKAALKEITPDVSANKRRSTWEITPDSQASS